MNEIGPLGPTHDTLSSEIIFEVGAQSVKGSRNEVNEDHYIVTSFQRSRETLLTNIASSYLSRRSREVGYAMVVADGVGLHAGEIASKEAISKLVQLAEETPDWIMKLDGDFANQVLLRLRSRFNEISRHFAACARQDRTLSGMGSTITVAASIGLHLIIGHIGDTRCYLLRDQSLTRLTRDQTFAQAMIDAGTMDAELIKTHPMRDALIGVIAAEGEVQPAQLRRYTLRSGDQLLLCSDGLTDTVDESQILTVLRESKSADLACRALVQRAVDLGCSDDVTAIVCRYNANDAVS